MSHCHSCHYSPCRCSNHGSHFATPQGGQHLHVHGAVQSPAGYSGEYSSHSNASVDVYLQTADSFRIPSVGQIGDLQTNIPAPPSGTRLFIPGRGLLEVVAAHGTSVTFKNISIQTGDGYDANHIGKGVMLHVSGVDSGGVVMVDDDTPLKEALKGISPGQFFMYRQGDTFGNKVCKLAIRVSECSPCDIASTGFLPVPLGDNGPVWAAEQTRIAYIDQTATDEDAALDGIQQSGTVDLSSVGVDPSPGSTAHQILIQPEDAIGTVTLNGQLVANFTTATSSPIYVTVPISSTGDLTYEITLANTGTIEVLHIGDII